MAKYTRKYVEIHLTQLKNNPQTSAEYSKNYGGSLPNHLYKYRSVSRNNLEALRNNFVWMCTAESFNDPIDSTVNINFGRVKTEMVRFFLRNVNIIVYGAIKEAARLHNISLDPSLSPEKIGQIAQLCFTKNGNLKSRESRLFMIESGMPTSFQKTFEQKIRLVRDLDVSSITAKVDELLVLFKTMNDNFQALKLVYSMASNFDNNAMWDMYADHFCGYCIEYDLRKPRGNDGRQKKLSFFPIIYGKKKEISAGTILDLAIAKITDSPEYEFRVKELEIQIEMQLLTKDTGWKGENEWRYLLDKSGQENKQEFPFEITRIILGKNILRRNQQIIVSIARKYGVPVYKQEINATHSMIEYKELIIL